ncbi:NusA-like transcription termination signal-binding factor [Candidatus Woesearchaeota archaeon]|nr:NusA-like transcription termination signal-binding factor [Candidatus Woesearchaeota archaeon]
MARISYNAELLEIMKLFENITDTKLKDCFIDHNLLLTFIVQENQLGKAIGKKAVNVRRLEKLLNRKIKIVEFNPTLEQFVKNLVQPLKVEKVNVDNGYVEVTGLDTKTKAMLIGRNKSNLTNNEDIIKKYFQINGLRVL